MCDKKQEIESGKIGVYQGWFKTGSSGGPTIIETESEIPTVIFREDVESVAERKAEQVMNQKLSQINPPKETSDKIIWYGSREEIFLLFWILYHANPEKGKEQHFIDRRFLHNYAKTISNYFTRPDEEMSHQGLINTGSRLKKLEMENPDKFAVLAHDFIAKLTRPLNRLEDMEK